MTAAFGARGQDVVIHEPVVLLRPEQMQLGDHVRIDAFVKLEGGTGLTIGAGVHVPSFCHLGIGGGTLVIEAEVGIAGSVRVLSGSSDLDLRHICHGGPAPRWATGERASTVIERWAFLGNGCLVLPGLRVGTCAIVAAGAVVTRDVPPWEVWGGVPARKLRDRPRVPGCAALAGLSPGLVASGAGVGMP